MGVCDDLISRQAAIDAIVTWTVEDRPDIEMPTNLVDRLLGLPSAPRWIPVTEQLPKLGEKVLVSTKNTVFTQVFKRIYGTPDMWGWEHNSIKKVTAWMPLPETYKEKKNNAKI